MFDSPKFRALKTKVQRKIRNDERVAYIGDGSGTIHVPQKSNYVWVRFAEGDRYSQITPARMDAAINVFDGAACIVATVGGELAVVRGLADVQLAQGAILTGSVNMNPLDPDTRRALFTGTLESELLVDQSSTPSQSVYIYGTVFVEDGILHTIEPQEVDLSGEYPSAGNRLIAVLFLDTSDEIEVQTSTAVDATLPILPLEIQEAINGASTGAKPIYAISLVNGDNEITRHIDGYAGSQLHQDLRSTFGVLSTPAMETIIAPTTLGSTASNIQLGTVTTDPLPTTYTQLLIALYVRVDVGTGSLRFRFNNDTGSNYSTGGYSINDAGTVSGTAYIVTSSYIGSHNVSGTNASTSTFSWVYVWISGYENTNAYPTIDSNAWYESSTTVAASSKIYGAWQSTSVVEEIDIFLSTGNFIANSVYAVYGIK